MFEEPDDFPEPTARLRNMILTALDRAGGVDYLTRQADDDPGRFMTLIARILPLEDDGGEVTGRAQPRALEWQPPV